MPNTPPPVSGSARERVLSELDATLMDAQGIADDRAVAVTLGSLRALYSTFTASPRVTCTEEERRFLDTHTINEREHAFLRSFRWLNDENRQKVIQLAVHLETLPSTEPRADG